MKPGQRFRFDGELLASKSAVNRLLCVRSHYPELEILGDSEADDVRHMRSAVDRIIVLERAGVPDEASLECGDGGTVLRFLALRCSRLSGRFLLQGSRRLFSRPMDELMTLAPKLGFTARLDPESLSIESRGWRWSDVIEVDCSRTTQFATGLLLNAWGLAKPLELRLHNLRLSRGYWEMSLALAQDLGMRIATRGTDVRVEPAAGTSLRSCRAELDMDAAFAVAALAAVSGSARIHGFPASSLQPDGCFPELLASMGVPLEREAGCLRVDTASSLDPIVRDLGDTPDLFPVLAVLCAFADGVSRLFGAEHLRHKESDRLANTERLLSCLGVRCRTDGNALVIHGEGDGLRQRWRREPTQRFDPDEDHRMAIAAAVAVSAGAPLEILHPEVVDKSFPGFWSLFDGVGAGSTC